MSKHSVTDESGMPELNLLRAMVEGPEAAILNQEARGQSQIVNSDVLPAEVSGADRAALEAAGLVFHEPVDGDEMFIFVSLPEGWKKRRTEHSMWSELVDEKGRHRASIFYKAAFYDRSAHMSATNYISLKDTGGRTWMRDEDAGKLMRLAAVTADGEELHAVSGAPVVDPDPEFLGWGEHNRIRAELCKWLDENRAEWRNPAAYWEGWELL